MSNIPANVWLRTESLINNKKQLEVLNKQIVKQKFSYLSSAAADSTGWLKKVSKTKQNQVKNIVIGGLFNAAILFARQLLSNHKQTELS